ncbi:putative LysM domain-containing protein [Dioscorea sansibarensis]
MARRSMERVIAIADTASWCCAMALVAVILVSALQESTTSPLDTSTTMTMRGERLTGRRPCEEIYVVGEGETLHTISDKCGDPFIVERNPHIHDPDDVFPGLVITLQPSNPL